MGKDLLAILAQVQSEEEFVAFIAEAAWQLSDEQLTKLRLLLNEIEYQRSYVEYQTQQPY